MTTDIDGHATSVVDRGYRASVAELRSAQKPTGNAPAYVRFVNRPLGRRIDAVAFGFKLTPNAISGISAGFTLAGIAVVALVRPTFLVGVLVALLFIVGCAFDAADGQLARLRGGGTLAGEWLDHVLDSLKLSLLHIAVLVSAFRFWGFSSPAWLLIPAAFAVVQNVLFFTVILNDQLSRRAGAIAGPVATKSIFRSLLVAPTDYGVMCLVFFTLGAPLVFLTLYAVLLLGSAGYLAMGAVKWFRDAQRLDAGRAAA